jgi:hypothetical protein
MIAEKHACHLKVSNALTNFMKRKNKVYYNSQIFIKNSAALEYLHLDTCIDRQGLANSYNFATIVAKALK